ncbi:DUF1773 domain-containing protein [Myxococcota bacterium]|nr:DUF1773 domain-containing protein [Myxococcota bacterium]
MNILTFNVVVFMSIFFYASTAAALRLAGDGGGSTSDVTPFPNEPPPEAFPLPSPPASIQSANNKHTRMFMITVFPRVGFAYHLALSGRFFLGGELFAVPIVHEVEGEEPLLVDAAGVGLGAYYYFGDKTPAGWHLSAFMGLGEASADGYDSVIFYEVNGLLGYRWLWKNGFFMDLGGGAGYLSVPVFETRSKGGGIRLQFSFGWMF